MYYDFTPQEEERLQLAAFFGITIDPVGYGDLTVVILFTLVLAIGFAATVYIWINRHYAPLKAKNIPLMTGIYLHSVFFFIGDLSLCGLVHVRGPFFGNCVLMLIWFRSMFGNFALGSLLAIRSYKLYRVFCKNKPMHGHRRLIPYLLFFMLVLIAGMVSSLLPRESTVAYLEGVEFCIGNKNLVTTYCSILWCIWVVYMVMIWLLRNIRSSFNEFREMAISLVLLITCTLFNQIILYRFPRFSASLGWRLALVSVDQITANYIWWLIMFRPIFKCIFKHDSYLAEWKDKLTADGLRSQYGIGGSDGEISMNLSTLVYSQADTSKSIRAVPSYTESTQLAINQLTAFTESCQPGMSTAKTAWENSNRSHPSPYSGIDLFRTDPVSAQHFIRRNSEPYASASSMENDVLDIALSCEGRTRYNKLGQRALAHCNPDNTVYASEPNMQCVLEIDRSQLDTQEILGTIYGRGSLDCHIKRTRPYLTERHKWQHSETNLSSISRSYSGERRLL
ncbi:hypothetical protein COEREDRAFT_9728 [Coemansia reversa NRRL 1564]|uniref:G-protein coupled receptors family 3 profile domain-containing protein n=1 Tax=Coemansia reversa (strain ATCC 12441 / NRRL 1564) TaxID=763665 RepID=A0A2G5B7X6_COERN|nr:hypothetical protein COEREDRAFT_9728 [Coemansia reversa NRRL 1564]|eukprot:PIA15100.1 hypothetical protein COEREDRAFT_9728 [Coemansia reversa NRRL 1564]